MVIGPIKLLENSVLKFNDSIISLSETFIKLYHKSISNSFCLCNFHLYEIFFCFIFNLTLDSIRNKFDLVTSTVHYDQNQKRSSNIWMIDLF